MLAPAHVRPVLREHSLEFPSMGGVVRLLVACGPDDERSADRELRLLAGRMGAWAARLTRFDPTSELCALDGRPSAPQTTVGPTLASVLAQARSAMDRTEGAVDISLLDARLAAETGAPPPDMRAASWALEAHARGSLVRRWGPVRFDLDGVAKGWIADRALAQLRRYPAALVDADGDIAVRAGSGTEWGIDIADPRAGGGRLARLDLAAACRRASVGVATSGTSIHRWPGTERDRHHLIDPATRRPAVTDIVQATVIAEGTLAAESIAKAVVIRGSQAGLDVAERAGALGVVVLLESGAVMASTGSLEWLA